ncbi:MAG: hypothetical protein ACE5LH_00160 [Fidelibacterota bacterium]
MNRCLAIIRIVVMLVMAGGDLWGQGVSYVRYYRTEDDFLRGIPMMATERTGVRHLRVFYDREDRVLSKGIVDETGKLVEEEIFGYDDAGNLSRRAVRDGDGTVKALYVYGDQEPMSRAFIAYAFPHRNPEEFRDRVTLYRYGPGGRVLSYRFFSVDLVPWGSIEYDYSEGGAVREERWIRGADGRIVRRFATRYDPLTGSTELTEYDSTGGVVSRVAVVVPGEKEEVPGDTGRKRPIPFEEQTGKLPDWIYLRDGDTLRVEILQISESTVRFKLFGEEDVLTMPLERVGEIERGDGTILYPRLY